MFTDVEKLRDGGEKSWEKMKNAVDYGPMTSKAETVCL